MNVSELSALSKKKTKFIIGLMSGTSVDGVDTVLAKIDYSGIKTKIKQLGFLTYYLPKTNP